MKDNINLMLYWSLLHKMRKDLFYNNLNLHKQLFKIHNKIKINQKVEYQNKVEINK